MVEAFATIVHDQWPTYPNWAIAAVASVLCFLIGLTYSTQGGYFMMDLVDHFCSNYALVFLTGLECFVVGWLGDIQGLSKDVEVTLGPGLAKVWVVCIKYIDPAICFLIVLYNIVKDFADGGYEGYPAGSQAFGWLIFIGFGAIVAVGAFFPQIFLALQTDGGGIQLEESSDEALDNPASGSVVTGTPPSAVVHPPVTAAEDKI